MIEIDVILNTLKNAIISGTDRLSLEKLTGKENQITLYNNDIAYDIIKSLILCKENNCFKFKILYIELETYFKDDSKEYQFFYEVNEKNLRKLFSEEELKKLVNAVWEFKHILENLRNDDYLGLISTLMNRKQVSLRNG